MTLEELEPGQVVSRGGKTLYDVLTVDEEKHQAKIREWGREDGHEYVYRGQLAFLRLRVPAPVPHCPDTPFDLALEIAERKVAEMAREEQVARLEELIACG